MIDPLVSLAHSIYSNKGVYAVLLGSGLSSSAGIPTGWEITLELIRHVAAAEGIKETLADPADWFRTTKGRDPDYSALLDALAATPDERRAILHGFLAPTPEDIEAGVKVPTAAHRAVAQLAARGYIRVILTTNFDRLTEIALRDAGVEPTVISSADDAAGAIPLTHAACVVVKVHGDYLDTRIRNTPAELAAYEPTLNRYLDRVLDEFGLIIVGWSGEWDEALRAAIARCPTRRFTTWWAARGGRLLERARDLAGARRAQIIAIESADRFFSDVEQKVLALEEVDRPHPLSAKVAVAELKRYLADPQPRIRLHDLVFGQVQPLIAMLERAEFHGDADEFPRRIHRYEAASEVLRSLMATGARWSPEADFGTWPEVVRRLCLPCTTAGGDTRLIQLRVYPAVLAFYAAGLGAIAGGQFRLLRRMFEQPLPPLALRERTIAVEALFPPSAFAETLDAWHVLYPPRGRIVPASDRIFDVTKGELRELAGDMKDFEALFDRFEILVVLSYLHRKAGDDLTDVWAPVGRFVWRTKKFGPGRDAAESWFSEAQAQQDAWPPVSAGMFGGSYSRFKKLRVALERFVERVPTY